MEIDQEHMPQDHTLKLLEFVEASKSKGASDEFLVSFLTRRGWPQDDVYTALGAYWERATGLAVPDRTAGGESSRDAFLYLLAFFTLATWSGALGSMFFRFIDHWFPDPVSHGQVFDLRNAVTWQMASVAVAFPIFYLRHANHSARSAGSSRTAAVGSTQMAHLHRPPADGRGNDL
jgi:hypothetical protein